MDISKKTNSIIGYLAGSCTAFAFIPQVWDVFKTKNTKALSLLTLIIFFIGQLLWITHGFYGYDGSVFIFSTISSFLFCFTTTQ